MTDFNNKKHWETIYETKSLSEVSWYQQTPTTSLEFIEQFGVSKSAKIIDVGGGDSFLVDHLLDLGYTDLTVLDISGAALKRAKARLGDRADKVNWVESNIVDFNSKDQFDVWHDRAVFHFLTAPTDVEKYIQVLRDHLSQAGKIVIGTFSESGPEKCSGIKIQQYSPETMEERMRPYFEKIKCITVDHPTPFGTTQNFTFCSFCQK